MAQITYTDKTALNINGDIADTNKVNASDMNEIKSVVNNNYSEVGDITTLTTTDNSSVVNAINEINDNVVVLYSNDSGSNTAITLSDSVANYDYIEVFYRNNDNFYTSRKYYKPNGNKIILDMCQPNTSATAIIWTTTMNVSGASLTIDTARRLLGTQTYNNNYIYITRVLGYKK